MKPGERRAVIPGSGSDNPSPSDVLREIVADANELGADTVEIAYEDSGVEVMWLKGGSGVGTLLDRRVGQAVIDLIYREAGLERRSRGKLKVELEGVQHEISVQTYENFGEWAYRLEMAKRK